MMVGWVVVFKDVALKRCSCHATIRRRCDSLDWREERPCWCATFEWLVGLSEFS